MESAFLLSFLLPAFQEVAMSRIAHSATYPGDTYGKTLMLTDGRTGGLRNVNQSKGLGETKVDNSKQECACPFSERSHVSVK